jgi:hypothetical protein
MGYGARQVVAGQPRIGLPFGLFSVLSLRNAEDQHWTNGIEWEAMTCDPASGFADPNCTDPQEKFFTSMVERGEADSFVVYGSAKCGMPGGRADLQAEEAATAHLLAREEAQAERYVWSMLAAQATDLNPAGALDPDAALAALEKWLGGVYGSLGVLHGDRGAVTLWNNNSKLRVSGSRLVSTLGTPIVAGAGYNGVGPDAAGSLASQRGSLVSYTSGVGSYTLTFKGETSPPIYLAGTLADAQAALNTMSVFQAPDNVVVTGAPTTLVLTWQSPGPQPNISLDISQVDGIGAGNASWNHTILNDGAAPVVEGETWVYASPALFGYRGAVLSHQAFDQRQNDMYALAERQYVVGFDPCGVAAVRMVTV